MHTVKSNNSVYHPSPKSDPFLYNKLSKQLSRLENKVLDQGQEIKELKQENKALREENARLNSILDNNSKNSSLPPSSDQKPSKSPNEYNSRVKTGRKPGGQPGRLGTTLTREQVETSIKKQQIQHKVTYVGKQEQFVNNQYISKYVLDLDIKAVAHEYRFPINAPIPKSLHGDVTYGPNIQTLVVDLYSEGSVASERISTLISNITNGKLKISLGSVNNFIKRFAHNCQGEITKIRQDLLSSNTLYTDSTNVSLNGIQSYIRNHSTESSVLYTALDHKNLATLREQTLLGSYTGTLVHDHETALYHFGRKHGECNAHTIRYLTKTVEETGNDWARQMIELLTSINQDRLSLKEQEQTLGQEQSLRLAFTKQQQVAYRTQYDNLITLGEEQNKQTKPRFAQREEKKLLTRLRKYADAQLLFMYDFDVGFTNNMSERDLRKCKTKQKVSGGFRKNSGKEAYCAIMSIIETCKRRDLDVFQSIQRIICGGEVLVGE